MSRNTKYIVIKQANIEIMVIFDELLSHKEMALALNKPVISAGFVNVQSISSGIYISTYGESMSLNIKSRESDSELAKKLLNLED